MRRLLALLIAPGLVTAALAGLPAAAGADSPKVVPGRDTATPGFVTGIDGRARTGSPVAVAKAYLASHRSRYGVDIDGLKTLEVVDGPAMNTVRFGQTYRGIDVFGAQYLVHMTRTDEGLAPQSVNGHYYTDLNVNVSPLIGRRDARRLAVERTPAIDVRYVEHHGRTILPTGPGVPAYHFTLWGRGLRGGEAKQEVFINSRTGAIALTYNDIQTDGPAVGHGVDVHGRDHELHIYQRGDRYELRDQSRPMFVSNGGEITTHDAQRAPSDEVSPTDENIVSDDDTSFTGSQFTSTGAVDAHWASGRVYQYYLSLGRNSIDNNGMDIVSLVNASAADGGPLYNASWNGSYMTYGNPSDGEVFPFSASLDVVGHELTHGVIDFSSDLVSIGQSGVMNEAYADYFGNAIDVNESGIPMDAPGAGFVGEGLCAVPDPERLNCPVRNLNTSRTIDDYILFLVDFDNGGVHLNSPIYGAALWDIREALGGPAADKLIYVALTEFMTPIDTLTDGRNALMAAADALGYTEAQKGAIAGAFNGRGIVEGWDLDAPSDALTLIENHSPLGAQFSPPKVAGPRFIAAHYAELVDVCCAPEEIYVGRVDGTGSPKKIGQDEQPGTINDELPDISGRRAVWAHLSEGADGTDFDVNTRRLGGKVKRVAGGPGLQWYPAVDGNVVAWEETKDGSSDIWARRIGKGPVHVSSAKGDERQPDVSGPWVAYWDPPEKNSTYRVRVENIDTGRSITYSAGKGGFLSPPSLSDHFVYWYQNKRFVAQDDPRGSIVRARLGSRDAEILIPEFSGQAPYWGGVASLPVVSGNDKYVAFSDERGYLDRISDPGGFPAFETGRNVWIISSNGGDPERMTCNRGDQAFPAIGDGTRVVWMDTAHGRTDLVTRESPKKSC